MVFERIEQLKQQYTDKYVTVDESRPELLRFRGSVGRVKTVNMSGRALVEFNADANIGWYDIDPDYLKIVDRPKPQPPEARKKAAPAKPASSAPAKPPAAAAKPSGKLSTADILAAARGKPAAKPPAAAGKMSTADILAAARGGTKPAAQPAPPEPVDEAPTAEVPQASAPAAKSPAGQKVDRSKMSVADMVAWCRAHDGA